VAQKVPAEFWHGNPRRPLGRARSRWEDTIKITLKKLGRRRDLDWFHAAQNRDNW
jgi:hypothetical protein